jgi:hypothetical protein
MDRHALLDYNGAEMRVAVFQRWSFRLIRE